MRLLVIVDTYVPARISGALQMRDLVREMLAQGHRPAVVVPAPELDSPWRLEDVDGVEVLRVRTLQAKDVNKVQRALAEWRLPYALLRGLRRSPLAGTRWDGLVWYSPTIFLGPMVRALKRECGCRGYLILRDLFPDWAVDAGMMRKGLVYRPSSTSSAASTRRPTSSACRRRQTCRGWRPTAHPAPRSRRCTTGWRSPECHRRPSTYPPARWRAAPSSRTPATWARRRAWTACIDLAYRLRGSPRRRLPVRGPRQRRAAPARDGRSAGAGQRAVHRRGRLRRRSPACWRSATSA